MYREEGKTLVICCEGNAGFYEIGMMGTPVTGNRQWIPFKMSQSLPSCQLYQSLPQLDTVFLDGTIQDSLVPLVDLILTR